MGSYATWRAAMMCLLYPENILDPALRRAAQTPGFTALIQSVQGTASLTAAQASQFAAAYDTYFRDVCSLEVTLVRASAPPVPPGSPQYLFGIAANSGTVYWSSYDPAGPAGYRRVSGTRSPAWPASSSAAWPRPPPDRDRHAVGAARRGPGHGRRPGARGAPLQHRSTPRQDRELGSRRPVHAHAAARLDLGHRRARLPGKPAASAAARREHGAVPALHRRHAAGRIAVRTAAER